VRSTLLVLGPLIVIVGAVYVYLTTGRFVSTDNAYVKSDVGIVSALISGPIVEVAVRENQPVAQGDVLFKIDEEPFRVKLQQVDAELGAVAFANVPELRLAVIRLNPDLPLDQRDHLCARAHQLPGTHLSLPNDSVSRRRDPRIPEVSAS